MPDRNPTMSVHSLLFKEERSEEKVRKKNRRDQKACGGIRTCTKDPRMFVP
jgi:hypothetical protein